MGGPEHKLYVSKGDGEHSYHKNSTVQRSIVDELVFPILAEALKKITLPPSGKPIVVADLGTSHSPNTITNVSHVVETLRSRRSVSDHSSSGEFQVYYNDLAWHDFNALFQLLTQNETSNVYIAGVPGSFTDRLFPRSSVHVFLSAFSVHFLSKIPNSVRDENSPAFNKGNLWLDGSTDATAQAYKEQSLLDLKSFLLARSEELAPGGLLSFIVKTRPDRKANALDPTEDAVDAVQVCLRETAAEVLSKGILKQEQVDVLNVPMYYSLFEKELLEVCKSFSSTLEIVTGKEIQFPLFHHRLKLENRHSDSKHLVHTATRFARGILGGIFEQVMADEEQHAFWETFGQIAEKKYIADLRGVCHFGLIAMIRKDSGRMVQRAIDLVEMFQDASSSK